jgi:hypothetical protein
VSRNRIHCCSLRGVLSYFLGSTFFRLLSFRFLFEMSYKRTVWVWSACVYIRNLDTRCGPGRICNEDDVIVNTHEVSTIHKSIRPQKGILFIIRGLTKLHQGRSIPLSPSPCQHHINIALHKITPSKPTTPSQTTHSRSPLPSSHPSQPSSPSQTRLPSTRLSVLLPHSILLRLSKCGFRKLSLSPLPHHCDRHPGSWRRDPW